MMDLRYTHSQEFMIHPQIPISQIHHLLLGTWSNNIQRHDAFSPHNSGSLHLAFTKALLDEIDAVTPFVVPTIYTILSPTMQAYFPHMREISWGKKLKEIAPQGEEKVVRWANF